MTPQEYRKKVLTIYAPLLRLALFLHISDIKIMDKNVWKSNDDYYHKIREINPYNPLSYILLLLFLPIVLLINGFNRDSFADIKKLFIYR